MPYENRTQAKYLIQTEPNEALREFLGVCGLNPWFGHDSSSRQQMFASHLGQCLVINGATQRFFQTGMEREYGKYTFSVKMPVDGAVIKIIHRYLSGVGEESIPGRSPQQVIIYEDHETKEVGCINITTFCSNHPYFGFEYKPTPELGSLHEKKPISKDTILLNSPNVADDGGYKFGIEANMLFATLPGTSEDGIIVSEALLPRLGFKKYERRTVSFGRSEYPLNIFGTPDNYKPFPEIGELVRTDGLLMATRKHGEGTRMLDMSIYDTMNVVLPFDRPTYATNGEGRIIDIKIHHDAMNNGGLTPFGMDAQPAKYDKAKVRFYQEIWNEWKRLHRTRGKALLLTPEFSSLVKEAISVVGITKERIHKNFRREPLDDYRIEFIIEYNVIPTEGFKLTDCHGGKGVFCKVEKVENMPIDQHGNRAEIVMDPNSTVSRMNLGRLFEQFYNAARRDVRRKLSLDLGIEFGDRHALQKIELVRRDNPTLFERSWNYLLRFIQILSPRQANWHIDGEYRYNAQEYMARVLQEELFIYLPPENEPESEQIMADLRREYMPLFGPVQYVGNSGNKVITKLPMMIASMYVLLLEKTADDWTAVASGNTQHFGVLSQMTNSNKYTRPTRFSPIRADGEAEVRIKFSYAGAEITAETLDRNNNPSTHKMVLRNLLTAAKPSDVKMLVDRTKNPLGQDRPKQMVKHLIQMGGSKFVYAPATTAF